MSAPEMPKEDEGSQLSEARALLNDKVARDAYNNHEEHRDSQTHQRGMSEIKSTRAKDAANTTRALPLLIK